MARPRKQTYTLDMYLNKIRDKDISNDADVQRNFVWKNEQINELLYTVLTDDYIPPIILGEVDGCQLYIVDGGQRSSSLSLFKYGNYRITKSIENPILQYKSKIVNDDGSLNWEDKEINLIGKTYETLPKELKKKFDEYQLETVIHENCTMKRISELIKKYNLHTSMNTNEKALTYIPNFARKIRSIINSDFFINHGSYSDKEKNNGMIERVILECDMLVNHFDKWNKEAKRISKYLNENASEKELSELGGYFERLAKVITEDVEEMFTSKDTFLWMGLYKRFLDTGLEDIRFIEFLDKFNKSKEMKEREIDGQTYRGLCINQETGKTRGTKDKYILEPKLHILETLMFEFLHIDTENTKEIDEETFIADVVGINKEDVHIDFECYKDTLKDLKNNTIRYGSKLLNEENNPSLLAMVAYSYKKDEDLEQWLTDFASRNNTYNADQRKNFCLMRNDFDKYLEKGKVA